MVTAWTFTIPGPPVPAERPRVGANGGHTITPRRTVAYQQLVALSAVAGGLRRIEGAVSLHLRMWFSDKRRRDVSNVLKSVEDGLVRGGILPGDHWQILRGISADAVGVDALCPRVEVTIRQWSDDASDE